MKNTKEEALAVAEEYGVPAELLGEFDIAKNTEGLEPTLPQLKILHQAQMFQLPDGSKTALLTGVILNKHRANAWWERGIDEGGERVPPDCSSINGIVPDARSSQVQSERCENCPQNQFGSDEGGKGKACKNMLRVHILLDGDMIPSRITLPPSNLRALDNFVIMCTNKGLPLPVVRTTFSLASARGGGTVYSVLQVNPTAMLDREDGTRMPQLVQVERMKFINHIIKNYSDIMYGSAVGTHEI